MLWAQARQSSRLPIGTRSNYWMVDAARWFPSQNPDAIAQKAIELLATPALRHAMRKRAYLFARDMVWKKAAQGYMGSFARVRGDRTETPRVQFSARNTPKALNQLPELKLNHVNALTDDTGDAAARDLHHPQSG